MILGLFFGGSTILQVSTAYQSLMRQNMHAITWLWKSCCHDKHKVFFWLLIHNRLNTRALLQMKIPLWLNIHVSCVMLQPRRPETTCSSNDPLHYIVGNSFSHIGIHWLLVHMLICNKFSRVLRCKLHSFSLWRSLCLYYRHCGHPEMILSSKGLLPICTVAGENSRMNWLSLFKKLNSNLILVSKIGWTTLYSCRFSLQASSLFLFF
jgi:hypothetical protein